MRILFVGLRHDYGIVSRGLSFEYYNFYEPLTHLGHDVSYFDLGEGAAVGVAGTADAAFAAAVERTRPDLVFSLLFGHELTPGAIRAVTERGVPTVNWFADDHWRFDDFTSSYATSFSWVATTARSAVPKYNALGVDNVMVTQWAAAHRRYRPTHSPLSHDVTFVGQLYGERGAVIDRLAQSGIPVETWGTGWGVRRWHRAAARAPVVRSVGGRRILSRAQERTRADQQQMIEIFGTSRVNINLTDSSQAGEAQIKGRTFEVPACGGFLLTGWAQELEAYFEPGREVAVFRDTDELVDKSRFYLDHEESRRQIALAGYQRTVAEHTYERRLSELIRSMGLTGRVSR